MHFTRTQSRYFSNAPRTEFELVEYSNSLSNEYLKHNYLANLTRNEVA